MKKIIIALILTVVIVLALFFIKPTGYSINKEIKKDDIKNHIEINYTTIIRDEIEFINYTIVT